VADVLHVVHAASALPCCKCCAALPVQVENILKDLQAELHRRMELQQ
jgi:hypothetical protein